MQHSICNDALVQHDQEGVKLKPENILNKVGDLVMQEYKATSLELLKVAQ